MQIYQPEEPKKKEKNSSSSRFFLPSAMNEETPMWEKIVFFLLAVFGIQIISLFIGQILVHTPLYLPEKKAFSLRGSAILNDVTYLIAFSFFLLLIFLDKKKTPKRIIKGFQRKTTYAYAIIGFLSIFFLNQFFRLMYRHISFYARNQNQTTVSDIVLDSPFFSFFAIVLFAPFCEEIGYRVGLVDTIGHKPKFRLLGILLSGIIFGLIHFDFSSITQLLIASSAGKNAEILLELRYALYNELLNLPLYILPGIILAFLYAKTGEIATSISAHLLNNLLSFICILWADAIQKPSSSVSQMIALFLR